MAMDNTTKTCLILLVLFLGETNGFNLGHTIVKSNLLSSHSHYTIAPELFRNSSFAFAAVQTSEQTGDKVGIDVTVTIVDKYSMDNCKCSLTLRPDDTDSSIIVTSLKRLSDKKVVLMGLELSKDDKRKGFLISLDVKNCETLYLYSSFDLAESHVLVTRESSDKFEIFMNRRLAYPACSDNKSRITFKPGKKEFHCFEVEIDWSDIFIGAFSFSEDVVMVRGFDATTITYKLIVYNTAVYPYRQQLWLVLPHATNKTQVVSADLALCWILNPQVDKAVHCVLIDKAGNLKLNKTLNYKQPVKLLSAVSQSDSESEIIVLAEKAHCDDNDCENIFVTKVTDKSINHRTIKLNCSAVDKKRLIFDVRHIISKGAVAFEYICETFNRFVLHSINIDDS